VPILVEASSLPILAVVQEQLDQTPLQQEEPLLVQPEDDISYTLPAQCSTGTRPPGWGSWGTRPPRPRDGGTPGGTFPHVPFLGRRGGTWGDATPQGGGRDSPKGGLLDVPP
jgi:hypothetical protein